MGQYAESVALNPPTGAIVDSGGAVTNGSASLYGIGASTVAPANGGLKFDSVTNDTADWQTFVDYLTGKTPTGNGFGRRGVVRAGVSILVGAVTISERPGWSIHGAGRQATVVRQNTDNVPCFTLGGDSASTMHSWGIDGIQFDYTNSQPSTNTAAVPIHFGGSGLEGYITNCLFARGCYAMDVASGKVAPWGLYLNMLWFASGITKGVMDWTAGSANAAPNNLYGHFYVQANNMVGPIFNLNTPENLNIEGIEINTGSQGPQLINVGSGASLRIGVLKIEVGTYAANQTLINIGVNTEVNIGTFKFDSGSMTISGAGVVVKGLKTGGGGHLTIDVLDLGVGTLSGGAVCHAIELGGGGTGPTPCTIGSLYLAGGWDLADAGSSTTQDTIRVVTYTTGQLSGNKGDADYTVALGDPNIISFETALTAARTVNLPSTLNNLHGGLWYRVVSKGAVNGANTLIIKCGGTTKATIAADNTSAEMTWRRHPSTAATGWRNTARSVGLE